MDTTLLADLDERNSDPRRASLFAQGRVQFAIVAALLLTLLAWHLSNRYVQESAQRRFEQSARTVVEGIKRRLQEHEQVLRQTGALLAIAPDLSRDDWRRHVTALARVDAAAGVQSIGLSMRVSLDQLAAHTARFRADGAPDYRVHPDTTNSQRHSVVYIEPLSSANQHLLGFDLATETVRRAAMARAADTGQAALSGRLALPTDSGESTQPGLLFFFPIYADGAAASATVAQRRADLRGFAFMALRTDAFINAIMGAEQKKLVLTVTDALPAADDGLIVQTGETAASRARPSSAFHARHELSLYGRIWTVDIESTTRFVGASEQAISTIVLLGSVLIDLLMLTALGLQHARRNEARARCRAEHILGAYSQGELRFQMVIDATRDGMVIVDKSGRIAMLNPAATRMFGHRGEDLLGQPIELLIPMGNRQGHTRLRTEGWPSKKARVMNAKREVHALRADGTTFPVEIGLTPMKIRDQAYVLATVADISDRKARESDREKHMLELERSNQSLEEFAHVTSHDLRAPLRAVDNLASWIVEDAYQILPETSRRHLDLMRRRLTRMEKLLDDLLVYARVHRDEHRIESVDLAQLFDEINELAAPTAGFTIDFHSDCGRIRCQRTMLRQVLLNLVSNAIKHHDRETGTVRITCREIVGNEIGGRVAFVVSDDGPGIPEEFHEKVFQMYQTLRPRDELDTSGMGLALVRRIVLSLGGSVAIDGGPGRGTEVHFTWPCAAETEAAGDATAPSMESDELTA